MNDIELIYDKVKDKYNLTLTNSGMPGNRRYFMMGNALVCGIVSKLSEEINQIIDKEK